MPFVAFPNTGTINPVALSKSVAYTQPGTPTNWPAPMVAFPAVNNLVAPFKTTGTPING